MSRRAFVGLDQAQYIVFFLGSTLGIIRYPTIRRVADAPPGGQEILMYCLGRLMRITIYIDVFRLSSDSLILS